MNLNYEIVELSHIDQIVYSDGNFHFKVNYLVLVDQRETVLEVLPDLVTLLKLPLISDEVEVHVRHEDRPGHIMARYKISDYRDVYKYAIVPDNMFREPETAAPTPTKKIEPSMGNNDKYRILQSIADQVVVEVHVDRMKSTGFIDRLTIDYVIIRVGIGEDCTYDLIHLKDMTAVTLMLV